MIIPAILLPALLGLLVLSVFLKEEPHASLLERLCFSYPLGMGLLTLQMFFLGLLRVPLTLPSIMIPLSLEIIVLCVWIAKKKILLLPGPSFGFFNEVISSKTGTFKKIVMSLLIAWVIVKLGSVFALTLLRPIFAWDVWANWGIGGKLFFYSHSLLLDVPESEFFGRGVASRLLSYPPHSPLLQAWLSLWLGRYDEILVKLSSPFYLLSAAGCIYSVASRETSRPAALGILVIFLSSPLLSYHAVELYSDLPLGVLILLAMSSFLFAMRGRQGFWPLVGFFGALALFTKNEALAIIAALAGSALAFIWLNRDRIPECRAVLSLLIPLLLAVPWFVFKHVHSLSVSTDVMQLKLGYHLEVLSLCLKEVFSLECFSIVLIAFPVLFVFDRRPIKQFFYLFFPLAFYALSFLFAYVFTGYHQYIREGTIFYRNVLTYYPSVCFLTIFLLSGIWKQTAPAIEPKKRESNSVARSGKKRRK